MESEGLCRCLDNLATNSSIRVKLTTDASITIIAMMRMLINFYLHVHVNLVCKGEKYPNIIHSLDIWHKSKKLRKSLTKVQTLQICNTLCLCKFLCDLLHNGSKQKGNG